jgi:hypothetical protein
MVDGRVLLLVHACIHASLMVDGTKESFAIKIVLSLQVQVECNTLVLESMLAHLKFVGCIYSVVVVVVCVTCI